MVPHRFYPVLDLKAKYQQQYLAQDLEQDSRYANPADRQRWENRLIARHNPVRRYIPGGSLRTIWGDQLDAVLAFTQTLAGFESHPDEDKRWECEDMLGCGGFGKVALWVQRNARRQIIDQLAVKQTAVPMSGMLRWDPADYPIPEEAIIQADLQQKRCIPVLQLRGLKCLWNSSGENVMRYYTEYCPYGDLFDLVELYQRWNRNRTGISHSIPEAFLWQLLYRFSQVLLAMEDMPFDHPNNNTIGPDPFYMHFDIKLENIFVGDFEDEDIIANYPGCKVADWGLALLTSYYDDDNSSAIKGAGTLGWQPPEQINRGTFGQAWQNQPPWRDPTRPNNHTYTIQHSVYQFGLIMYALLTLDNSSNDLITDILTAANGAERDVQSVNYYYIQQAAVDVNVYGDRPPYSDHLKQLVVGMLCLNPDGRPTPTQLEEHARISSHIFAGFQAQGGGNIDPAQIGPLYYGKLSSGRGNFPPIAGFPAPAAHP